MDSNNYVDKIGKYDFIASAGQESVWSADSLHLKSPQQYIDSIEDWAFGHFNFEWQHNQFGLTNRPADSAGFSTACLFQPEHIIYCIGNKITILSVSDTPESIYETIDFCKAYSGKTNINTSIELIAATSKNEYLETVIDLQNHIRRGDCYEINYCIEFSTHELKIDALSIYQKLSKLSPAPMSCLYRNGSAWLICSSPERFIAKRETTIFSQPIKGTIKRNISDIQDDELLKTTLLESVKNKIENVMIVDLVRNDFSKICKEGSVEVMEKFGIYSFAQVHQMISTIKGTVSRDIAFTHIMQSCFPMGSMTGAPKKRVLELVHQYESSSRGIFSGSVGYIGPDNDFDWNVVIRSIMYNDQSGYLGYKVGGGITFQSDPIQEYEECMLKALALQKVLSSE